MTSTVHHHDQSGPKTCTTCGREHPDGGLCRGCTKKIVAIVLAILVVTTFVLFFGIL